jgi:4-hydroxy-tetrahydrodipicolinate synthase
MFRGSFVALITPFTHSGRIDRKALSDLVEWHIQEKTDGIICSGTTSEACTLSDVEKNGILKICLEAASGRIPILAGTGTCDTRQSVRLTRAAKKLGASGCLVVSPYYNKPTKRGCVAHYREIAKIGLPIIAYNNPGRTGFAFPIDFIRELELIPEVVAIKDCSANLTFVEDVCRTSRLAVFGGDDDQAFPVLQKGCVGTISVIANAIPFGWRNMVHSALDRDFARAAQLFNRYYPLCKANFIETNPQCIKYIVSQMGRCKPVYRLPMVLPTAATQNALKQVLFALAMPSYSKSLLVK